MNWYWELQSGAYGRDEFGPYDTKRAAEAGIKRVQKAARTRKSKGRRFYSELYKK